MDLSLLTTLGIQVITNARLANLTTFKLGGPCLALIECTDQDQVTVAIRTLRASKTAFILMGFGSNILASDNGADTVIVRYTNDSPLIKKHENILTVDAGTQLDDLAKFAVESGLAGMTTFSGIPGTVGGAIAGNAGAYGAQISDSLQELKILRPDSTIATMPRSTFHFEYRDSDIKHNGMIILSAQFKLDLGNPAEMNEQRQNIIKERESKHGRWKETPCAGSFFRNIEPTSKADRRQSAGGIIEQCGGKALRIGGAHSFHAHANIITRDEGASAHDVYELTEAIKHLVKANTGIELVREVRLLGEFNGVGNKTGFW